jgi:hypothetical protein
MRFLFAISLACLSCGVHPAEAGAWLKEKGTGFASLSFGAFQNDQTSTAIFVEYGLSDTTTIGIDINAFVARSDVGDAFGVAFLRRSLGPTDRNSRFSYEVGVGAFWDDEQLLPAVKSAVSWGRGIQFGDRSGWMNVDAAYIVEPTLKNHTAKLDATAGLNFTPVTTGILELNLSQQDSDFFSAVEPSVLIKPKSSAFQIKLGARIPMDEGDSTALKLGIWRSF